jgi:hypothetical protein
LKLVSSVNSVVEPRRSVTTSAIGPALVTTRTTMTAMAATPTTWRVDRTRPAVIRYNTPRDPSEPGRAYQRQPEPEESQGIGEELAG